MGLLALHWADAWTSDVLVAAGPLLRSQRCVRWAASPLAAGSPCNLLFAAAGGAVTRRCTQVLSLVLTYGVGRLERECTRLRARFTRPGHSVADRCYPRHNHTRALVRKTRSQEGRKEQRLRGVHPFVNSNVMCTAAHPRAALP